MGAMMAKAKETSQEDSYESGYRPSSHSSMRCDIFEAAEMEKATETHEKDFNSTF